MTDIFEDYAASATAMRPELDALCEKYQIRFGSGMRPVPDAECREVLRAHLRTYFALTNWAERDKLAHDYMKLLVGGALETQDSTVGADMMAETAYALADAMLKARL